MISAFRVQFSTLAQGAQLSNFRFHAAPVNNYFALPMSFRFPIPTMSIYLESKRPSWKQPGLKLSSLTKVRLV